MMRVNGKAGRVAAAVLVAVLAVGATSSAAAADTETDLAVIKRELRTIRAELSALRREMRQMRVVLTRGMRQQKAPTVAKIRVKGAPSLGRRDAPVTVVEFSDYQCPFCRRFFNQVLPRMKKAYLETGKIRLVFKDFPIQRIHPHALPAAIAARCAGEQGKYWQMHNLLFANPKKLTDAGFKEHAGKLGLDGARFGRCLASGRYKKAIFADEKEGQSAGVRGTPTFVVGRTTKGDSVEGIIVRGAQPFSVFKRVIEGTLSRSAHKAATSR